jgi:cytochrome c oxidase subunit 2
VAIIAIEIALLAVFSIPAWSLRASTVPSPPEATVVRVVAEQFSWNVHYPGDDGRFGQTRVTLVSPSNPLGLDRTSPAAADDVTTINELHVPVDVPVIVYLTSKDVVHSFTLLEMRVKQDTIPGSLQTAWFTPTRTGRWEIICSQLCGLAHYRMRGFFVVESRDEFRAWLGTSGL